MKTLTQSQFEDLLLKFKGAKPVSLSALSDARLKAPYNDVLCYSKVNGMVNAIYQNSVNNQRAREGKKENFIADSLPYGKWHKNSRTLIQHKESIFLRLKRECVYYRFYIRLAGNKLILIPAKQVEQYMTPASVSLKQGVKRQVEVRNYKLNSICFATIDKQVYRVR